MSEAIINMSNEAKKFALLNRLKRLEGPHRISVVKYRPRRSDRQNRYYWPCFVRPFADFIRDQGERITDEHAHQMLKHRFLKRDAIDKRTGEVVGEYTKSTTSLDTAEFNEYLDQVAYWLSDMFGIMVPDPDDYHEKDEPEEDESLTQDERNNDAI